MSDILIFGTSAVADVFEKELKDENRVIGYINTRFRGIYKNLPLYLMEEVRDLRFDYILIAVNERKKALELQENICKKCFVSKDKVIPVKAWEETQKYRILRRMIQEEGKYVDGVIIGNSHAEYGLYPSCFDGRWVNFSSSVQDIYNSCGILEESFMDPFFQNVKYLIFDLFDYNYFNIDSSLTDRALLYAEWGGRIKEHNFSRNKNWSNSFEDALRDEYGICSNKSEIIDALFNHKAAFNMREGVQENAHSRWKVLEKDAKPDANRFNLPSINHVREDTICDNEKILEKTVSMLKNKYPKLRIIFTLLPRYIASEVAGNCVAKKWESGFDSFIDSLKSKYNCLFWNYKDFLEVSMNHYLYNDQDHLNTVGARVLSSYIATQIRKL